MATVKGLFTRGMEPPRRRFHSSDFVSSEQKYWGETIVHSTFKSRFRIWENALRKYRDDLFFYLYIVVFDANCKLTNSSDETERMKKHITNWIKNGLSNLSVNEVLRAIGRSPNVNGAVVKYKLQAYFTDIGKRLNSYVHSNGYAYYNLNINAYKDDELYEKMNALLCDMKLITITFLFLLILCSPLSVMSNDYIDFLDSNMEPPSGAQYWVAPFAEDFIKENICLIDKSCINYLQDNTPMQFSL